MDVGPKRAGMVGDRGNVQFGWHRSGHVRVACHEVRRSAKALLAHSADTMTPSRSSETDGDVAHTSPGCGPLLDRWRACGDRR